MSRTLSAQQPDEKSTLNIPHITQLLPALHMLSSHGCMSKHHVHLLSELTVALFQCRIQPFQCLHCMRPALKPFVHTAMPAPQQRLCFGGCICRSWLLPVLQDALDAMTKEKARMRADMEYLQTQLDMVTQQAEAASAQDIASPGMTQVGVPKVNAPAEPVNCWFVFVLGRSGKTLIQT